MAALPAGTYGQIRIRFEANPLATEDRDLNENACGNAGPNCVVMPDGTATPLLFAAASAVLHITAERISGGSLLVVPDMESNLVVEVKPVWTLSASANNFGLHPVLIATAWLEPVAHDESPPQAGVL